MICKLLEYAFFDERMPRLWQSYNVPVTEVEESTAVKKVRLADLQKSQEVRHDHELALRCLSFLSAGM